MTRVLDAGRPKPVQSHRLWKDKARRLHNCTEADAAQHRRDDMNKSWECKTQKRSQRKHKITIPQIAQP